MSTTSPLSTSSLFPCDTITQSFSRHLVVDLLKDYYRQLPEVKELKQRSLNGPDSLKYPTRFTCEFYHTHTGQYQYYLIASSKSEEHVKDLFEDLPITSELTRKYADNFSVVLTRALTAEEFVKRLETLAPHAILQLISEQTCNGYLPDLSQPVLYDFLDQFEILDYFTFKCAIHPRRSR